MYIIDQFSEKHTTDTISDTEISNINHCNAIKAIYVKHPEL